VRVRRRGLGRAGVSLVEVLVGAVLLLVVMFGLAQFYSRGRRQIGYEEDRRKATLVAQHRLDGIRRDYRYEALPALNNVDTTLTVDGKGFTVRTQVVTDSPESLATTVTATVRWTAQTYSGNVTRSHSATTILARGMP
jgi:Tfp pilus assembly protein PilV